MSEIRVTSVVGENGGDRVGLTTGLTVGPLTGTTGIGATITHHGHAQFAGVCTATSFVGSGANLTSLPSVDYQKISSGSSTSTVSSFIIDNLDVTTFSKFILDWQSIPVGDNKDLHMRFRTGGASGVSQTGAYYDSATMGVSGSSGYYTGYHMNQSYFVIHRNAGNQDNEGHGTNITIIPRKSGFPTRMGNMITAQGFRIDSSGNFRHETTTGYYNHGTLIIPTGIYIDYEDGDGIGKYNYVLYGVK